MENKSLILDVGDDCSFKLADGRTIKNLKEFSGTLENMDEWVFKHHANNDKNDFSAWAKNVLKDEKLAGDLLAAKDKSAAQVAVLKRIIDVINQMTK